MAALRPAAPRHAPAAWSSPSVISGHAFRPNRFVSHWRNTARELPLPAMLPADPVPLGEGNATLWGAEMGLCALLAPDIQAGEPGEAIYTLSQSESEGK